MAARTYYVSYMIKDGFSERMLGEGAVIMSMDLPATAEDVKEIGKRVTRLNHETGHMHGQYAVVQSWSPMEER